MKLQGQTRNVPQAGRSRTTPHPTPRVAGARPLGEPPSHPHPGGHFSPSLSLIKATLFANEYLLRDQLCIGQSTAKWVKNENKIYSEEFCAWLTHSSFPLRLPASRARRTPSDSSVSTPCAGHTTPPPHTHRGPVKVTRNKSSSTTSLKCAAVFRPLNMRAL